MTGALRDPPLEMDTLRVDDVPPGTVARRLIRLVEDALGRSLSVPALIARGAEPGPVLGVTAAVHGNELNGIPAIHRLIEQLDCDQLRGTVVGIPIVNVPAYLNHNRTLKEGMDLNRLMPGRADGNAGEQLAFRLRTRLIEQFDYLVDLHTASFGRVNSLYVRANLRHPVARDMAVWQGPEIVVHNEADDGTLRRAAMKAGIPAITVEVGDPQRFQRRLIKSSVSGLFNILYGLELLPGEAVVPEEEPVICDRSSWYYAERGGLLEVFPGVTDRVRAGDVVARITNLFGDTIAEFRVPRGGVVVGKSTNPVCESGSRILHVGHEATLDDITADIR